MQDRTLRWDGVVNGRDLAGLPLPGGGRIGPGRLCRSAAPGTLSHDGWTALVDHGIRTILDLRTPLEIARSSADPPPSLGPSGGSLQRIEIPLEPEGYADGWARRPDGWKIGTPHYYREFLAEHGHRLADALSALAAAADGGVLVHCGAGRDRCGLVIAMALELVGVDHELIVADHWLSYDRDQPVEAELGLPAGGWERPALDRASHATALRDVLAAHPARACFADAATARSVRAHLLARLLARL